MLGSVLLESVFKDSAASRKAWLIAPSRPLPPPPSTGGNVYAGSEMNKMTKYPYTVEEQEDGKFLVQFVDFPEGFTEGDTEEEAEANASEVLSLLLETYSANGEILPEPSEVPLTCWSRYAST